PEDVSGATAKAQLTADNATLSINNYKTDTNGIISKAQADIKANADAITQKVSQTDYDTKTGQLTTSVSKAQQTADTVTTSLGNYKQDADGRISANSADIITNANAIKQKVAQSDYDANNTKLTSRLTTVETTANGTATTVSNLNGKVNNLGQLNRLLNTEFNPDYAAWTTYGNAVTLSIDRYWLQNGSNNLGVNRDQDQSNWGYATQKIAIGQNTTFSFSVNAKINSMISSKGRLYIHLRALDVNGNAISDIYKSADKSTTVNFERFSIQNAQTPAGTTTVELAMGMYGGGSVSFNHPFFVLDSHIGNYVAGNYSNSDYLAQVKITADTISNFVRDSSGNISSDFQTALSKTSIITDSTLATSIQKQTATQITSALTDNNGKIISLINQDSSGVQIAGKNIILDGNVKVTNAFTVGQANIANGAIGTAQIGDAAITSAKIADLDVSKITGDVTNFIQSYWNGRYGSTTITSIGMSINSGSVSTTFGTSGMEMSGGVTKASYKFGTWKDWNDNLTTSSGLYMGIYNSSNSFVSITGPSGATALLLAGSTMDYGNNTNIMRETLNIFSVTNVRERLVFKGNKWGYPSFIDINEDSRTFNFYTGSGSQSGGNYFWFNQKVLSSGTFSSTSTLSKKNVLAEYTEDALQEILKTNLVTFEYKNRPGEKQISPIIDDVNKNKKYYIPSTILGEEDKYVDMYSMITMAWKAIKQLSEKIGDK
ncbi:MAG: hypothetical protein ABF871_09735, partial [Leuconostoc pseudomesenteroides]